MATIDPIQIGAAKITFPVNLPKNEKDIICMVLAGRLKDLMNGKLVCVELAVNDLINKAAGPALSGIRGGLQEMKSKLNELKDATGYNNALEKINAALGEIETVFSLGGLCPSPVHAPKIPDVLGKLNSNLFGQLNGILNSLISIPNPKMCLGGGPDGFGINYNNLSGSLKQLNDAIDRFLEDPAGLDRTLRSFENNIKRQNRRLTAEIKQLKKNITDPFGVNKAQATAGSIMAAKSRSDGYAVKAANGVTVPNVLKSILTPDVESAVENGDSTLVETATVPILDYCGDVVGFETVSTVPGYNGWSTDPDAVNQDTPTALPVADFTAYDFNFVGNGNSVELYDKQGTAITDIEIVRGNFYRLGFHNTPEIALFVDGTTVWTDGLEYNHEVEFGQGIDVITPNAETRFTNGYVDWQVLLQGPTTPNNLVWATPYSQFGNIVVSGPTEIPPADRVFDVSEAVRKALLHIETSLDEDGIEIEEEVSRSYTNTISYAITEDADTGDKIITSVHPYNSNYLIIQKRIQDDAGFALTRLSVYESTTTLIADAFSSFAVDMTFDGADPVDVPMSTRLPAEDRYNYVAMIKSANETLRIDNADSTTFTLANEAGKNFIRWDLTSNLTSNLVGQNDFLLQTDIEIDYSDLSGAFTNTNPKILKMYLYIKTSYDNVIELIIEQV